jgi:uncharacterized protein (TIGR01777 family)
VQPRTILISGASGFIGSHLARALAADGHRIVVLARPGSAGFPTAETIAWDPARGSIDSDALRRAAPHFVINLAGERIDQRWTRRSRERIRDSRVSATRTLADALAGLHERPAVLLSASAVGIYGAHRGDDVLSEQSAPGADFLARTALEWEGATRPASDAGIRVAHMRTGVVLGPGGALARLRLAFRLGLGGRMGSGRQWMAWIAHDELPHIVRHLLGNDNMSGAVNVVAPEPVQNSTFTRVLARAVRRPALLPVPAVALQLVFGEMARDTILASQRAAPRALLQSGYSFRFPTLEQALRHELAR